MIFTHKTYVREIAFEQLTMEHHTWDTIWYRDIIQDILKIGHWIWHIIWDAIYINIYIFFFLIYTRWTLSKGTPQMSAPNQLRVALAAGTWHVCGWVLFGSPFLLAWGTLGLALVIRSAGLLCRWFSWYRLPNWMRQRPWQWPLCLWWRIRL